MAELLVEDDPKSVCLFVKRKLLEQGRPSISCDEYGNTENCYYRHPVEPLKCAAGWLIPDEEYDPSWEDGMPISYTKSKARPWFLKNYPRSFYTIELLQQIHDMEFNELSWRIDSLVMEIDNNAKKD